MTGIICPSVFEYRALDRKRLERLDAVLIKSGMGKLRVMLACFRLIRQYPSLRSILLIGFAGGLTHDLKVGDVVEPHTFIEQDYCAEPFEKFPNRLRRKHRKLLEHSRGAVMLTQDRFLMENPYRAGQKAGGLRTLACDMESYAAAKFCDEYGLRFHAVKLISDSADADADHDFLAACRRLAPKLNRTVLEAARRLGSR